MHTVDLIVLMHVHVHNKAYAHVFAWILYLLLSCILATKPVRGICGVSWTIGGGGGGATDTGAATPSEADKAEERQRAMEVEDREIDNDK